ncbi:MAG: IS256 family transposase [Bacteroidota bacterium]
MTHDDITKAVTASLEDRVRAAIRGVLEEAMEEEMTAQLQAQHRERTERRRGERNGHYGRALTTAAGHIEQIRVPRAREMPFLTEVFERYRRMTGSLEESVLEMYLQGISTRKIDQITGKLSGTRISKDAVSRIAARFEEVFTAWRTRRLDTARSYPYLYLDATYLKARWAGAVRDVALLVAVGVSDEGHREVLAVETAAGERSESWRGVLQGLVERGLRGVKLVISDGHEAIKHAVQVELSGAAWQRCTVHFQRNVLAHVPQVETREVAVDLKPIFQAARRQTAEQLSASFAERYGESYPKAVAVLSEGLDAALTYTAFPSSHHRLIRTTNGLERVFREVKRRTRVVGVFPSQESAETLATAVLLRVSEDWCERKYLDMTPFHALFHEPTRFAT